jgi:hypothetical protein
MLEPISIVTFICLFFRQCTVLQNKTASKAEIKTGKKATNLMKAGN